jgi:hypothetical protein
MVGQGAGLDPEPVQQRVAGDGQRAGIGLAPLKRLGDQPFQPVAKPR